MKKGTRPEQQQLISLEEGAFALEEAMRPPPSVEDFACIFHKCPTERNRAHALRLHAYLCQNGLEAHTSLGNDLVSMFVEVGSMSNAQQVFDRLVYRNELSWNSLITGYIKCGEPRRAFILYQKMQEDSLHPSGYTFVALLKACAKLKDLEKGHQIHAEIAQTGLLETDVFIGSTLVDMYAKCGSLSKAQEAFDKLPIRNVVSWNALIAGYTEHGHGGEALDCFEQMQCNGVSADAVTFVCSLKACGCMGATDNGRKIHGEIAKNGLESDLVVGSTLVDMYTKCGLLAEAHEVFDKLLVRDGVLWNTLIAGYAGHGHGEEALHCFEQMQTEGMSPDTASFVCSLKACASIGAKEKGQEIHAEITKQGLERDLFVANSLVDMYAKCGSLVEAQEVFDNLLVRDKISWNALIAGYVEHKCGEKALDGFERMQHEGISPDDVTFICCLKACGSIRGREKGREIHADIFKKGLEKDLYVGNTLVDMYTKCGSLAEAHEVFDKLPALTIVSWTALITGYVEHGCGEEALDCFEQMQHEGVSPLAVTLVCSLKACASIGAMDKGQEIHAEIARKLLERDPFVGNTLVDMYAKCGLLAEAQEVFDKLLIQDEVSWNALISGYVEHERGEEALDIFEQMQYKGISQDAVTFICSLKACGSIGAADKGQKIHAEIARKGLETNHCVGNTLIDMYAKCGLLEEAHGVFDKLIFRGFISWNALITGYGQLGESQNVFHIFDRMIVEGIKPNLVTCISILNACSHGGLVEKGQMYLDAMSKDYGIIPTLEHCTCMVDLLGRAGQVDKALVMTKQMPFHPSSVMWQIVLGACRNWGNVELGRQAFEHAVRLDEKDAGAYVCLSNIYAEVYTQKYMKIMGVP